MARTTRAMSKANTRAKLLRAASQVFAKRGFNAASIEQIAERAGFTRGAFYATFTSKADALLTLLEDSRSEAMSEIATLMAQTPDDQKLAALQGWYDSLTSNDPLERALAELIAQPAHAAEVRKRLAARQAQMRDSIAAVLAAYREGTGLELPLPDDQVASIILALGDGFAGQRHVDPRAVADDAFTTAVAYVWFGLLAGQS